MSRVIRERVSKIDPTIPVPHARTMASIISETVAPRRFQAALVSAFALLGLLLASIGVYGVVCYAVLQRRTEIGYCLRSELISTTSVFRCYGARCGRSPVGLCVGVLTAMALTRFMTSLLFQVRALDPMTFVVAPMLLAILAALRSTALFIGRE
jgi:hypothetical protein